MPRSLSAALAVSLICGPAASAEWLTGKWCDRSTKTLVVEEDQITFNGRNVCQWLVPPQDPPYISPVYCKNISTERGATIEKFHQTFTLAAEPIGSNRLRVTVGQSNTEYKRCD